MSANLTIRPNVLLPLRNARAFLEIYYHQGSMGGVLVQGPHRFNVGDDVDLEFAFAEEGMVFNARGIARWRRLRDQPNLPAGIGVDFLPSERRTRDLLIEFAQGKRVHLIQRQSRRFPVVLVVEYQTDSVFLTDLTDDLSREGAFICSQTLPAVGQVVRMKLKPPGKPDGIGLNAQVMWHSRGERQGFGVRFKVTDTETQGQLEALIGSIKNAMINV